MPDPLVAQLDAHVEVARRAGSGFYAVLLERMRADAEAGGPVRAALAGHERDRVDEWDAFRLLAGVHRLVLGGEAPVLERHYPSTGGDGDAEAAWPGVRRLLAEGRAELVEALAHPLQTNAPTRAKALVGGLCLISRRTRLPLRLLELGASGGLNLRLDRFRYEHDGMALGPESSPVRFVDFFTGGRPPLSAGFEVAERAGCDLNPIDPTTEEGRLTLLACIFPDETERFGLLERAIAVARETPVTVERADLAAWVSDRLDEPRRGQPPSCTTRSCGPTSPTPYATPRRPPWRRREGGPATRLPWRCWPSREARTIRHGSSSISPSGRAAMRRLLARTSHHPVTVEWLA